MKKIVRYLSLFFAVLLLLSISACNTKPIDPDGKGEDKGKDIQPFSYVVTPETGTTVDFHTQNQLAFLNGVKTDETASKSNDYHVSEYASGIEELSRPLPVVLSWSGETGVNSYFFELSTDPKFSDSKPSLVFGNSFSIYNLYSATEYFWRVAPSVEKISYSAVYSFKTAEGPRNIFIDGISNVRDLGGYITNSGTRVKQGLIYRGGRWNTTWSKTLNIEIKGNGFNTINNDLKIKTELDLRGEGQDESGQMKNGAVNGVNYLLYGCSWSSGMYPANRETVRRIFEEVLSDSSKYPIYFHCNIGTDRTGMIAYLLNGLLGVSEIELQVDYLLSNFGYIGSSRTLAGDMNEYVSLIENCDGKTYMEKVENFLLNDVGVSATAISNIRNILLC